jgi:pyruvate formate lyase activating enzyme
MSKCTAEPSEPEVDRSVKGLLLDVDRFASHDGPGIRTTVFLKGCPLRYTWCHSPESQSSVPEILFQPERCTACWLCLDACPHGALERGESEGQALVLLARDRCTRCGRCADVCYPGALRLAGRIITVGELVDDIARAAFLPTIGGRCHSNRQLL